MKQRYSTAALLILLWFSMGQSLKPPGTPGKGPKKFPTPTVTPTRTPMPYGDGISTSRTDVIAEGDFPTMALNTPTTDPTFGLTYTVIADNTFDPDEGTSTTSKPSVEYSHMSAFNADSTRVWLNNAGGVWVANFDPDTMLVSNWQNLPTFRAESMYFSRTDPDVAYSVDNVTFRKILKHDFSTGMTTTHKDFTGTLTAGALKQMSVSEDTDDIFAFTYNDGLVEKNYLVYQKSTDKILLNERMDGDPDLNECHINDTGEWLVAVGYDNKVRIVDLLDPDNPVRHELGLVWPDNAFVPFGHSDVGRDYMVGTDTDAVDIFRVTFAALRTSVAAFRASSVKLLDGSFYTHGMHISLRANDKAWAMVNFYKTADGDAEVVRDELVFVKVDINDFSEAEIRRVQKHRGEKGPGAWEYAEVAKGSPSPDGRFIAFTTNNKVTGRTFVVVTKVSEGESLPMTSEVVMQGVALSGLTLSP